VDQETMLHELEELAKRLEIEVRYESAAGRVGMARLHGRRIAVVDANLRVDERIAALATVLAGEDINGVYVAPAVRKRIERACPLRVRPERDAEADADDEGCDAGRSAEDADPKADAP